MRWFVLQALKFRAARLEAHVQHHHMLSIEHRARARRCHDALRAVRRRIALREDPQVLLNEALRGSRERS